MTKQDLKDRTKKFAVRVYKFIRTIPTDHFDDVLLKQLLRSSSSVAANYRSACRGKSELDFLNKLKIVDEEANESLFWLEFIEEIELDCGTTELRDLKKEANELVSIFSASIRTIKSEIKMN
jgi:four helix bundle protein